MTCTVCLERLNDTLVNLGETTHPACVSDLGKGQDHVKRWHLAHTQPMATALEWTGEGQ